MVSLNEIFDQQYYLNHNPDVANAIASGQVGSALEHYVKFGQFEGRSPRSLFSDFYVFGDSFSDTGNVFALTKGIFPDFPNYQGRFSNGKIWIETLAQQLSVSANPAYNFAVGGASAGTQNILNFLDPNNPGKPVPISYDPLPGIQTTIDTFVAQTSSADPNALYVVWGASNDYVGFASTDVETTVHNLETSINKLAAIGAKNFLVPNLFDLGKLPLAQQSSSDVKERLTKVSQEHNHSLSEALIGLEQSKKVNIINLDVSSLFDDIIAEPAKFGFSNVTDDFLTSGTTNPDPYLFWNIIHPTTLGHDLIADEAAKAITSVPEVLEIVQATRSVPEPEMSLLGYVLVFGLAVTVLRKLKYC
ncbi:lipolytic enzyme, G-D-S-L [Scytonema sp. HK-05]|uniref:SGNH/GDSL hydrolase family protein n=1 Tax=Scytonema sp. HK-05 TaxID=1137095 RepID=UPI0009373A0D|nr:SGNH/GDSL hydrolase family protein [Scytonema sp. HK-05]OKH59065.1 hypothetical protein NIES2130_10940 [Scytonema sp. HK-05]BAY48758.1 lipolytic enzyme, G-D-S-L [Scytonema sp. HK-05]